MTTIARYSLLATGVLIGLVMAGADLAGGGSVVKAITTFVIVVAYAGLVTLFARRSDTLSVLAGRPVDERWEHLNLVACSWALGLTGLVVLLAFLVADASGGAWQPYALMAVVIVGSYVGSLLILRARS